VIHRQASAKNNSSVWRFGLREGPVEQVQAMTDIALTIDRLAIRFVKRRRLITQMLQIRLTSVVRRQRYSYP